MLVAGSVRHMLKERGGSTAVVMVAVVMNCAKGERARRTVLGDEKNGMLDGREHGSWMAHEASHLPFVSG